MMHRWIACAMALTLWVAPGDGFAQQPEGPEIPEDELDESLLEELEGEQEGGQKEEEAPAAGLSGEAGQQGNATPPEGSPSRAAQGELDDEALMVTPEVVVTGTRQERQTEDAPVRTQVIDRQQIEQRQARNLSEALSYTTGVRVETNCQNCGFTQLRLNGLGGAYTQVLIDGLPSFSSLAGVYGLEQLPADLIERVEIVKGGGSALYGPSAVAGVVNVITRRPQQDFARALVGYEHVGLRAPDLRLSTDGAVTSPGGRAAIHLFATARRREALDLNGDDFTELVRLRQLAAGANTFYEPFGGAELALKFHVVREYRRGGDRLELPPHEAAVAEELRTERLQGEARWDHRVSDVISYHLGYVLAYTERRSYYGAGGASADPELPAPGEEVDEELREEFEAQRVALGGYGLTRNPNHVADAHLDVSWDALGPQVLTLGGQALIDDIEDRYLGYDRVIDDVYSVIGAYAQHDWIWADWAETVIGARVDQHSELDDPIASPRAALMLRPMGWLRLRSAYSSGFRGPQAFDEDLHIETVGGAARLIVNDPELEPERSHSLAQQVRLAGELDGGLELGAGVNGYVTRLQNAFVLNERDDPDTPEEELIRENRGTTTVAGAELNAQVQAPLWAARAGWTFERARNEEPDEDFGRRRLFRTPRHYGFLDLVFRKGGFVAQSGVEVTGPMLAPRYDADADPLEVNTTPWFFDWDINLRYTILLEGAAYLEPYAGVRNLLDSRQTDFDSGPDRDASYIYGPLQPRTVLVGVQGGL